MIPDSVCSSASRHSFWLRDVMDIELEMKSILCGVNEMLTESSTISECSPLKLPLRLLDACSAPCVWTSSGYNLC